MDKDIQEIQAEMILMDNILEKSKRRKEAFPFMLNEAKS